MNTSQTKYWNKSKKKFSDNIRDEVNYFKKPVSLETIINSGLILLSTISNRYLEKLRSNLLSDIEKEKINAFIRNSDQANLIKKYATDVQNSKLFSKILNNCEVTEHDNEEILDITDSDFDEVVNSIKLDNINTKQSEIEFLIFCLYFINYLVFLIIDSIQNYETPSVFRTKYLRDLSRTFASYMKSYMKKLGKNFKEIIDIIDSIKIIDALVASIIGASYFYITNRKKTQAASIDSINNSILNNECQDKIQDAFDINLDIYKLDTISINDVNVCDNIDEEESPSLPLIDDQVSCEVSEVVQEESSPLLVPDTVINAIIENKKSSFMNVLVATNSYVTNLTKIATLDSSVIYSPVEGYIDKIEKNKIYVRDISDVDTSDLEKTTTQLSKDYTDLYEIVDFLKKFNVNCLFPIMITNPGKLKNLTYIGVRDQFEDVVISYELQQDLYNDKIQSISKYENIKPYLDSDNIVLVKDKIEKETDDFLNVIKAYNKNASDSLYNNIPIPSDYELFDYYISLLTKLNTSLSLTEIEKTLKIKLTEFTEARYVLEKNKESALKSLISEKTKKLEKGISTGDYFNKIYRTYKENGNITDVKNYLNGLSTKNKKLKPTEKTELVNSIMYLFEFWLMTADISKKYVTTSRDLISRLNEEASWFKTFLNSQWENYEKIKSDIINIQDYLSKYDIFNGYTVKEENSVNYRVYTLSDNINCKGVTDSVTNPDTSDDLYSMKYWAKYFSFITLASVIDVIDWSTGLILPTGPVMLPVIYVPITSIKTSYGFIIIGLSICGVYFTPFVVYNNMTLSTKSIITPDIISIKEEIKSITREINNIKTTVKTALVSSILKNIKDEISPVKQEIADLRNIMKSHKTNKPVLNKKNVKEYGEWEIKTILYNKKYAELNSKKFKLQIRYKVVSGFGLSGKINSSENDASIEKIKSIDNSSKVKLEKLNKLIDKIDSTLAKLPTALAPNSVNFGATLKNPKLVVQIDTDTNASINDSLLDSIFAKHKKKNEDLMSKNFKPVTNDNLKQYYNIIKTSINLIIPNEPYPTYDRLEATNLGFVNFTTKFVKKGARSFGFPGMPPLI